MQSPLHSDIKSPMPPLTDFQSLGCTLLPTIFTSDQLAPLIPLTDDALSDPAMSVG
ncbi:MAG: hypothetical protein ACX94C_00560 [Phycisphaerales bacterium]